MTGVYPELYSKGSRIWIKHSTEVWQCVTIKVNFKQLDKCLIVDDENEEEINLPIADVSALPPLRNPDILIGANDLTSLSYLHEPAVLYNLRVRFLDQSAIYTWCGIVLVAINPFCDLEIYGEETIQTYHKSQGSAQLDPHIYAVSEDAYSKLERDSFNQSIIVSGESGAGKTVSAKFAMRYFASIAGSDSSNIEDRVLASNPIMEAIGNAKTTRNDNSSRFGKYIQILFDPHSRAIVGGNMRTYLLEKSRVSRQSEGERNFHIFYQMCTYAQQNNLKHLKLSSENDFNYLGQIEPTQYDDMTRFVEAMSCLGFSDKQQSLIFQVIAAILHAGNLEFTKLDDESCCVEKQTEYHLLNFCELLGLDPTATKQWLTHRVLKTGTGMREIITTTLTAESAIYGRDALLKFVYEKMFAWIVCLINKSLGPTTPSTNYQFIGVLDIYGFEHFETNSFEQFCINYANEVLQQQFNQHVFKLEQEEYIREGIDWQFITFTDNQPVIDVIEAKPIGILNLLDEECKMPKGTGETWCAKLYAQLKIGDVFQKPKFGSRNSFIIQHFADTVVYTVEGFLDKNRDTIWDEQIDLLKRSTIDAFFTEDSMIEPLQKSKGKLKITPQQQQTKSKQAKATVGSQFRESLADLMKTLNATEPHYVRCIKPNDDKAGFEFNNVRAVQQLRACGVLETIRISSNGFPSRWSYQDFANRYRVLRIGSHRKSVRSGSESSHKSVSAPKAAPRKLVRAGSSTSNEIRALCEDIVKIVYEEKVYSQLKLPQEEQQQQQQQELYQFGKTKIFFRSGQVALLERIRGQKLRECAILLQRIVRGWLVRRRYIKIRHTIIRLQCYGRAYLARKLYLHLKLTKAATVIQTKWRSWYAQQKYIKLKKSAIGLQRFGRGMIARKLFLSIKKNLAAITIQRYWRGYVARKEYQKNRRRVIIAQSSIRRFLARRQLKKLRIEAKSVEHVTNLNKGLERKIIELQQKIQDLHNERKTLIQNDNEISEYKKDMSKMEVELKNLRNELKQKEHQFEALNSEIIEVKNVNEKLSEDMKKYKNEVMELRTNKAQQKVTQEMNPKLIEEAVKEREKVLTQKFDKEKKALIDERENERASRQQLLRKYMALEDKYQSGGRGEDEEERSPDISAVSLMMRCSELEQECAKFKHENQEMRELIASMSDDSNSESGASLLVQQIAQMQIDLDRSREERSNLKTIVLSQENFSHNRDNSGENELLSAFKAIIKQLETEVDESKETIEQLRDEISSLKNDNNRQQQLIGVNSSTLIANGEQDMITRFQQENTLLREKCDKFFNENKQLRMDIMRRRILDNGNEDEMENQNSVAQEGDFIGMFEYKQQKEQFALQILILDLEPGIALKFQPHLPAYILFMCIRYTDYNNDDIMVRSILNNTILSLKRTIKKRQNVETFVLWLSNTCKLITLLKQYSGEEIFGVFDESLKNFDLSEYRQMFSDIAIWIHQGVIKQCEERIQSMIVPAILEYEGLASSGMYSQTSIQRSGSITESDNLSPSPTEKPIDSLIKELSYLNRILLLHVIDGDIIHQIFKQLFYFICASSLNNLLLRKDLCHWNKAMQIRFNLSSLEQWCREQQIQKWNEIVEKLDPIIQATKLLQTRKSEEHITTIVEMCNKLSSSQIIKILNLYTAGDEERISNTFIKKIQQHLMEQRKHEEGSTATLLMDTKYAFAFTIPYIPSDVKMQTLNLPPVLVKRGLATVLKKV